MAKIKVTHKMIEAACSAGWPLWNDKWCISFEQKKARRIAMRRALKAALEAR